MSIDTRSNRCSMCDKGRGMCMCDGCKAYFCTRHFTEHRQQLSMQFDQDVVKVHDNLLEQIHSIKPSNIASDDLCAQIDRWETSTILKIKKVAELARHQVTQLLSQETQSLTTNLGTVANEIRTLLKDDSFAEDDIERLQLKLNQLQKSLDHQTQIENVKLIINDKIDWNRLIYAETQKVANTPSLNTRSEQRLLLPRTKTPLRGTDIRLNLDSRWALNGITVAGGHGEGNRLNQFCNPFGLYVDGDQNIYVADYNNHWVVEWKCGATSGQVVAGGRGAGNRMDQLKSPTDVIVDEEANYLFICDSGNRRIVQWPRRGGTRGETIISNISCWGLTKDDRGYLYVSDEEENSVKRWRIGDTQGIIVAGGKGKGSYLNQLNRPNYVFVDQNYSVYVSDRGNDRVMKWKEGAIEGIVVAGGRGRGTDLAHMNSPYGIVVDQSSTVYVAECGNHRIMRWVKGATQGIVVFDENSARDPANRLNYPWGLSFDRCGNLYVVDKDNQRVLKFTIDQSSC